MTDNVNPHGPLDGGTAGGRVRPSVEVTLELWEDITEQLLALRAVADAARLAVDSHEGHLAYSEKVEVGRIAWMGLARALDALDKEG